MQFFRTIGRVIANLADGADPTAVRPRENEAASTAFSNRLAALAETESFLQELRLRVPQELHDALERSTAHAGEPITSVETLLERVTAAHTGQSVAVGRSDHSPSHPESVYAADLGKLERVLQTLVSEQSIRKGPIQPGHGSPPSAA